MAKKGEFKTYRVPQVIADIIDQLIKNPDLGYTTRASFIEDAVRRHIEKTKQNIIDEQRHKDHMEAHDIN